MRRAASSILGLLMLGGCEHRITSTGVPTVSAQSPPHTVGSSQAMPQTANSLPRGAGGMGGTTTTTRIPGMAAFGIDANR